MKSNQVCSINLLKPRGPAVTLSGKSIRSVGNELSVTNVKRLDKGIDLGIVSSDLMKLNQIGTLTETLEIMSRARECGCTCVTMKRAGFIQKAGSLGLNPIRSKLLATRPAHLQSGQ